MSMFTRLLITEILLIAAIVSCTEETKITVPKSSDWSYLSGSWSGEITILRKGGCTINNVDSTVWSVFMDLSVTSTGVITASEDYLYSEWTGSTNGSTVTFDKTFTFTRGVNMEYGSCSDSVVIDTVRYSGTIILVNDSTYTLEMNGYENWCSANNCAYELRYKVTKSI